VACWSTRQRLGVRWLEGNGADTAFGTGTNIQRSTSNIEHPMQKLFAHRDVVGCWMFDVRCFFHPAQSGDLPLAPSPQSKTYALPTTHPQPSANPKGIPSCSPALRGASYAGSIRHPCTNAESVASPRVDGRCNPVGVETAIGHRSQGRRATPTLGLKTESRWDSLIPRHDLWVMHRSKTLAPTVETNGTGDDSSDREHAR